MEFPKGLARVTDLLEPERLKWEPWLIDSLQPSLPINPLRHVHPVIRWRCSLPVVFITLFGNQPKNDNGSWAYMRFVSLSHFLV